MSRGAYIDWSGTASTFNRLDSELGYTPASVVCDEEALGAFLIEVRNRHDVKFARELKGSKSPDGLKAEVVDYLTVNCQVFAMVMDKSIFGNCYSAIKPVLIAPASGLAVLNALFNTTDVNRVVTDKGDISETVYHSFRTVARQIRFGAGVHARSGHLDVKPLPSHKSAGIQAADIVAWALNRRTSGFAHSGKLERACTRLLKESGNVVWEDRIDDLQPYLAF